MDIAFKPPRWAKSYIELMTFIQDLGVEVDEGRVMDRIMDECVVVHSVPKPVRPGRRGRR
jgi:hypothetical protein